MGTGDHGFDTMTFMLADLLVTVAKGMGYSDINSYGDITPSTGPLPGILV